MRLSPGGEKPIARLIEAARSQRRLLGNAGSMLGTTVVTSLLGVVFWWLAARDFSEEAVGVAAAAVGAMTLLGFLATLGLGTLLMGELPRLARGHRSLINAALAIVVVTGAIVGALFAVVAPLVTANLDPLDDSWGTIASFAIGVGLTALAFVLDQALIGLLRGGLQMRRNALFALVKLFLLIPIVALVTAPDAAWIYSAWGAGIGASLLVLTPFYLRRGGDPLRPSFAPLKQMRRSAASHHAFNLALQTPALALPVLVVGLVSAAANASFYVAWMIAGLLVMVPVSLGTVLYPIGSEDPSRMSQGLRLSLALSLAFGLFANLLLIPLARPLLEVFGTTYAEQGAPTLHILALGVFPLAFKTLYVSVRRVSRRLGPALPVVWAGTLLELLGAVLGSELGGGLTGIAWGWLAAVCIEGLVMGGEVLRAVRSPIRKPSPPTPKGDPSEESWIQT
jgi:O-antigen/teichoic acid export membrane protein